MTQVAIESDDLELLVRAATAFKSYVHLRGQNRGALPSPLSLFLVGLPDEESVFEQQEALELAVVHAAAALAAQQLSRAQRS